jgi:N-acetylmuramic acid 6-phosphate etherase
MPSSIRLEGLQTEGRNAGSNNIDQVGTVELCQIINGEDATIAAAVEKCIPIIAKAIDALEPLVRKGGRVVYVGAGTSGRYRVLIQLSEREG